MGRRAAMSIRGKHDAFNQDPPVSASLLSSNSAILQETFLVQLHTVTNVFSGLGTFVPYAISGAVYSGTLSPTALALTGSLNSAVLPRYSDDFLICAF